MRCRLMNHFNDLQARPVWNAAIPAFTRLRGDAEIFLN
jgi:hypothetical protein